MLAVGVPVDLADHRTDERKVRDEQVLVGPRKRLEVRAQASRAAPRLLGDGGEPAADDGLDEVLLRPELPEEGDLVDARLPRNCAGRGALKPVAREDAGGGIQKKLPCRGAPADNPGWGIHCKYLLA